MVLFTVYRLTCSLSRFQEGRWDGDVQREGGRQRRYEGCVQQPARHAAQQGHGVPVPRTTCAPRSTIPTMQAQSELTAGLTVNQRRG